MIGPLYILKAHCAGFTTINHVGQTQVCVLLRPIDLYVWQNRDKHCFICIVCFQVFCWQKFRYVLSCLTMIFFIYFFIYNLVNNILPFFVFSLKRQRITCSYILTRESCWLLVGWGQGSSLRFSEGGGAVGIPPPPINHI